MAIQVFQQEAQVPVLDEEAQHTVHVEVHQLHGVLEDVQRQRRNGAHHLAVPLQELGQLHAGGAHHRAAVGVAQQAANRLRLAQVSIFDPVLQQGMIVDVIGLHGGRALKEVLELGLGRPWNLRLVVPEGIALTLFWRGWLGLRARQGRLQALCSYEPVVPCHGQSLPGVLLNVGGLEPCPGIEVQGVEIVVRLGLQRVPQRLGPLPALRARLAALRHEGIALVHQELREVQDLHEALFGEGWVLEVQR
mmetsp:Transcript_68158/g.162714  ORF Transcript_68158/g.162714 Transcript_68158/m.162714 type:complete len:249 (+) Transcript_68158:932-1678(+)